MLFCCLLVHLLQPLLLFADAEPRSLVGDDQSQSHASSNADPARTTDAADRSTRPYAQVWWVMLFFFLMEYFGKLIPPFLISLMSGGVPGMPTTGVPGIPTTGVPGIPTTGVPGMPTAGVPGIPTAGVPSMPTENPASSPSNVGTNAAQQQLMQQMLQMFAGGGGGSATVHMFTHVSHMLNAS